MSCHLAVGVSSIETPFCRIYFYYTGDEKTNKDRVEAIDSIIIQRLDYIDLFGYEYKWDEDKINKLTPVKRQELVKRIIKRREAKQGSDAFDV